jgi:hypothetical protein
VVILGRLWRTELGANAGKVLLVAFKPLNKQAKRAFHQLDLAAPGMVATDHHFGAFLDRLADLFNFSFRQHNNAPHWKTQIPSRAQSLQHLTFRTSLIKFVVYVNETKVAANSISTFGEFDDKE